MDYVITTTYGPITMSMFTQQHLGMNDLDCTKQTQLSQKMWIDSLTRTEWTSCYFKITCVQQQYALLETCCSEKMVAKYKPCFCPVADLLDAWYLAEICLWLMLQCLLLVIPSAVPVLLTIPSIYTQTVTNKKLCYSRQTTQRNLSVKIAAQRCRNKFYKKSRTNRSNGVTGLCVLNFVHSAMIHLTIVGAIHSLYHQQHLLTTPLTCHGNIF